MFRITKIGHTYTHKCTQCYLVTSYSNLNTCEHCGVSQRMRADSGKSSGPLYFIMDQGDYWRRKYHEEETNVP